jgi:hypothetical protein
MPEAPKDGRPDGRIRASWTSTSTVTAKTGSGAQPVDRRLTYPWPEYAAAFVEIAAAEGRVLLRPCHDPAVASTRTWDDLAQLVGVPARTVMWIVTASDPFPHELDDATNAARAMQLEDALDAHGLTHLAALARSPDGGSREVSRAIVGATRAMVLDVAASFAQLAVFEITHELACVETATGTVMTSQPYRVDPAGP